MEIASRSRGTPAACQPDAAPGQGFCPGDTMMASSTREAGERRPESRLEVDHLGLDETDRRMLTVDYL